MTDIYRKYKQFPLVNVFQIKNAEELDCLIHSYNASLARLEIGITQAGFEALYKVVFNGVAFIDAPMFWKNASFNVADPESCVTLVRKFDLYAGQKEEDILDHFILYTVSTKNFDICILAKSGQVFE